MEAVLAIMVLLILCSAAVAGLSAAPWLPTLPSQRRHFVDNLPLKPNQTVVDLGCGDGSLLFALARRHPEAQYIGYDISLLPLAIAWIRKAWSPRAYRNVHIRFGNLFTQDVSQADVIIIFLLGKSYPKLVRRLNNRVKPEARVVVEAWPLPNLEPVETLKAEGLLPVYIYTGATFRGNT
jgi:cyclopropane fatty-acyl-phospholipid synthase-like methyltransferase